MERILRTLLQALLLAVLPTPAAPADESLSRWIQASAAAVQALHDGDAAAAAQAARRALEARPRGEAGARARLALGLALEAAGRDADAWPILREAVPELPARLRSSALRHLGATLERAGHPGAAAAAAAEAWTADALLGSPRLGGDSGRDALAEGRALLAADRPSLAVRALEAPAAAGDPRARLALARARVALGDARGARLLRDLWIGAAGEAVGEEAGGALESLRATEGLGPVPAGDRLARAERLLATARPRLAVAEIDAAEALEPASSRSRLLRALAALQLGRPADAETIADGVARDLARAGEGGTRDRRDEVGSAELVLARAAARLGRLEEAAGRYRAVARLRPTVPGLSPAVQAELPDEAAYLSAWLLYDAGRFAEGAAALGRFAREHPGARRAPDARWFQAWALRRAGRLPEARRALAALAAGEAGPLRAAALYWQARLAGDPPRAASLDRAAVAEDPDGWYGLLAAARLSAAGAAPLTAARPPGLPPAPPLGSDAAALERAADLLAAGLRAEGLAALDQASRGPGARGRAAPVAELAAFADEPRIPFRMARDHLAVTRRTERWAFPEPFAATLLPAATALGVDPALALAVMRRESAFETAARSAAAAEGVLQLRPETAERLATLLGVPSPAPGALADPRTSIPLGVGYLALLGSRFADAPVTVAAYNAGPGPAAAWSTAGAGTPLDEWVESLPWRETRQYVRGVVADWARYRRLRGEPPPPVDPATPVRPPAEGIAF
jgi:soluble lytic murein transglycosylase